MSEKMTRRDFLQKSAAVGASSVLGSAMIAGFAESQALLAAANSKIAVVGGEDFFKNTLRAVEALGGMKKFVPKGAKVAVLANPQRNNPGAFTKPEVLRAVIQMCKDAGAKRIACVSQLPVENWTNTGLAQVVKDTGVELVIVDRKDEAAFKKVPVPKGKTLMEAEVMKVLDEFDLFLDVPITKNHAGNKFTGSMKNLMGLNSGPSNRTFHKANWQTDPSDIRHLDQCIADLNTVLHPALCVVDANEFITTNGPFGPGELAKPHKVVSGADRVAVDAYCCTLLGLKAADVHHVQAAAAHGLGQLDLAKVTVKEIRA